MRFPSMADSSEETPPVTRQISPQSAGQNIGEEPVELRRASSRLVVDADGKKIPFEALYEQQKTIVVFVRHFLCYACKEYVEDLGRIPLKFLQDANVRLVVIGQSSHHHIKCRVLMSNPACYQEALRACGEQWLALHLISKEIQLNREEL